MKSAIIALIVVALAGGGFYWWSSARKGAANKNSQLVKTTPVENRDIDFAVNVAGEISPAEQVSVRPEVNGKIDQLPVDVGDRVETGQLLFSLDDKELNIEIQSRETAIEAAQLQLQQAKREFERSQRLFDEKLIAQELFENSRTTYELAQNSIDKASKELALAQDRLDKTRITAPFACTVLTRPVSVGQAVSGSGGFNSGTEVLTIADLNRMIINAHVNQADVTRLSKDMKVEIEVEAVPGLKVPGMVERIAPQATVVNNVKGFSARILLENVDTRIQPGMTANIRIPVESAANVLALPLAAIFSEEGERFVYVQQDSQFVRTPVQIGVADFFYVEILKGLKSDDVVAMEQPPANLIREEDSSPNAQSGMRMSSASAG